MVKATKYACIAFAVAVGVASAVCYDPDSPYLAGHLYVPAAISVGIFGLVVPLSAAACRGFPALGKACGRKFRIDQTKYSEFFEKIDYYPALAMLTLDIVLKLNASAFIAGIFYAPIYPEKSPAAYSVYRLTLVGFLAALFASVLGLALFHAFFDNFDEAIHDRELLLGAYEPSPRHLPSGPGRLPPGPGRLPPESP